MPKCLSGSTRQAIASVFDHLDYKRLESVYCYEGGDEFWRVRRGSCQRLGSKVAEILATRLPSSGRSLYVGAGVTELPALVAEVLELRRQVVLILTRAVTERATHRCRRGSPS